METTFHIKEGKYTSDKKEISNNFNNFFVNVGPTLAAKINNCTDFTFKNFVTRNVESSLFLNPVCENEVVKITNTFKSKKFVVMTILI